MVNLSKYELRLIAKNRGIKNYKNMTREKLLSTFDQIERNLNTISERRLNQITKMQNLSHNDLNQIMNMYNQLQQKLERVAKMRRIKNRKRMSKEELIVNNIFIKIKKQLSQTF